MKYIISTFLFFILLSGSPAAAADKDKILTLDAAIEQALSQNPSIAAAYYASQAAHARPPQAATPPDPQFMLQFTRVPINTIDVNQGAKEYMVEQKIPFPSKLVYGYKAEKRMAEALTFRETMTAQEIVRQIKQAYVTVWRLQEEERIDRRTLSIYAQSKGSTETAYATLEVPIADPVRASVNFGEIEAELALVEQERIEATAKLSSLLAAPLDPHTKVAQPKDPPPVADIDELLDIAKTVRPEIAEADKMIASEGANLSKAKSQYGPDLTLRWGYVDMPGGQQNAWTGRVMVTVPLWSLSKQRFGVRESKAMLKRAESLKVEAVQNTEADVKSSYARLMAAKKIIRVYSATVLPRARLLLKSSQEAYKSGKGDFLSVVDAIRSLNNAELMLVRAKADATIAHADLERAVGTSALKEGLK